MPPPKGLSPCVPRISGALWLGAAFCLNVALLASPAAARKRGFAAGTCEGCHGEPNNSNLSVTPASASPGEAITLRIVVSDSDANVGGLFVETDDLSGLSVPNGETLIAVPSGITHTGPKPASNGTITFELNYQVPSTPGATQFGIWAVAANGNDDDTGDEANHINVGLVYGCDPQIFYADMDRDGFGREEPTVTACAGTPPEGFAIAPDDCNDNDPSENPGAMELCNSVDDNCNGEIDENAVPVELFPDADGDGYYSYEEWQSGDSVIGCLPYPGYGDRQWDCDANNADAHPGAEEVCDGRTDENCDGEVDERVRPRCGEGACERISRGCTLEECTPGQPSEEICNFIDDDCDGELDEGDLCPAGRICVAGACRDEQDVPTEETGGTDAGGGSSAPPDSSAGGGPSSTPPANGAKDADARGTGASCTTGGRFGHQPGRSHFAFWLLSIAAGAWMRRRAFR